MSIEKGSRFPVLDDGFIQVVDWMGDDSDVCQAARTSYQKGTKSVSDDRNLIRYLMRHYHTTPFEMCELKIYIRIPMDCWRQYIRHRMASVNEYSTRYSEAIDSKQKTKPDEWRPQSTTNKQGSGENFLMEWPAGFAPYDWGTGYVMRRASDPSFSPGVHLSEAESDLHRLSENIYKDRLKLGVAREQARKDLPLSTYTEAFWKIDLHNLLHFLRLRMDSHAQLEIRSYANIIGNEIVSKLWPITWEAFQDYRLQAMQLTRLDIEVIKSIERAKHGCIDMITVLENLGWVRWDNDALTAKLTRSREREECEAKLTRFGIDIPWSGLGE